MNYLKKITAVFLLTGSVFSISSQNISVAPKVFQDTSGNIYWNKKLPLYLTASTEPNGQGTLLKSENPNYANPIYLDTEGTNYIRTRYAVDKSTQKLVQPLAEVLMPIIADGESPKTTLSILGDHQYRRSGNHYVGQGFKWGLKAKDTYSGVENIFYRLEGGSFLPYHDEMNGTYEGQVTIEYLASDRVGNLEEVNSTSVIHDVSPPEITHNINGFTGDNLIAASSTIYFTATDTYSGVKDTYYRFDDQNYRKYNGTSVPFQSLEDGEHTLEYYAVDQVNNQTAHFTVTFYYDKTAPLTASDILGDRYVVNDKIYFSGRTKMKLTAVDNKVGVKEIRYAIDNRDYKVYDQPFYLPSISGEHTIRFYSIDRLANEPSGAERYKHNISKIYLDLNGPQVSASFSGPQFEVGDLPTLGPTSSVVLKGIDAESGLKSLAYSLNGAQAETPYTSPFNISTSGKQTMEIFGYDNVNNRNFTTVEFRVDRVPPVILPNYSTESVGMEDNIEVFPPYVVVYLAATDDLTGIGKIYYSINGQTERTYTKPIDKLRKNTEYTIRIRAVDRVGNESNREISFKTNSD